MDELEALQAVATLGPLADHVENTIDELCTLGVVSLRPVVSRTALSEDLGSL